MHATINLTGIIDAKVSYPLALENGIFLKNNPLNVSALVFSKIYEEGVIKLHPNYLK